VIEELEEPGGPAGYDVVEPLADLADMFGQFFEDGLVVDLPEELLEGLLDDDELDLVEVLAAALTGAAFFTTAESVADVFVVTTCPLASGGESAKAAAVAPPTKTPDTPRTAIAYLSFGRMFDITSLLQVPPHFGGHPQSEVLLFAPPWAQVTTSCEHRAFCEHRAQHRRQVRVVTLPLLSVTTQKAGVVHDTAVSAWPGATCTGADQDFPDQVNTLPAPSTAMQNVALVHDTAVSDGPPKADEAETRRSGADQLLPFHTIASPVESTATQNNAIGHETPVSVDVVP
jgi:hypothetical protein